MPVWHRHTSDMDQHESMDPERFALFQLSMVDGLGSLRLRALLKQFGSAQRAMAATSSDLREVDGIGPAIAGAIRSARDNSSSTEMLKRMQKLGVRLVREADPDYPAGLREIHDPPVLLSVRGSILPMDRAAISIVGTRRCSIYGRRMAERLATDLANRGLVVVSGLARGIDGVAHEAVLKAGGRTIAVLASGLARIYPPEHLDLAERIVRQGALVTEAPLDGAPLGGLFPQRNRIISGISLGVIVVEAGARSGALSTARHALEQGREVFAVPGRVGDATAEGTNWLIRQGATMVTCIDDVMEQIGAVELPASTLQNVDPGTSRLPASMSPFEQAIFDALDREPIELELLLDKTSVGVAQASATLLALEMKRLVRRLPGNRYVRS